MYFVYVLASQIEKKSYVGSTDDVERRLVQHNSGQSVYTQKFRPWVLIYTETYQLKDEALKREKYFKTHAGRKFLKEVVFNTLGSGVTGNTPAFGAGDSRIVP